MKSYYELTTKEIEKYKDEFNKTPQGKKIYGEYRLTVGLALFCVVALAILDSVLNSEFISSIIPSFMGIVALLAFAATVYDHIAFTSWLKYKYNIHKW